MHLLSIFKSRPKALSGKTIRQRGASMVEFLIVTPLLMFLGLGIMQLGLVYHAKSMLNYATFEAARTGAVNNGQLDSMRKELGYRMAPIFGGTGTLADGANAIVRSVVIANDPTATKIEILNPTAGSFALHGKQKTVDDDGESRSVVAIPNSHLRHRPFEIKDDGLNVQDANLLKIRVTYGFPMRLPVLDMEIPGVNLVLRTIMLHTDPDNWMYYMRGMLPIQSTATVRMQSEAWDQQLPTRDVKMFDSLYTWVLEDIDTDSDGDDDGGTTDSGENTDGTGDTDGGETGGDTDTGSTTEGNTGGTTDSGDTTAGTTSGNADTGQTGTGQTDTGQADTGGITDPPEIECESTWEDDRYTSDDEENRWWAPLDWVDEVKAAAAVVWDFMSGVLDGLGDQVSDLWELLKDPSVMLDIARQFIEEPRETLEALVQDLGTQVQTVLECGPKDIGKIIGQNVNPVVIAKLVGKLGRLSGNAKLTRYADELDSVINCVSFPIGESVWTPTGTVPVETIFKGDYVLSRSDRNYTNQPQPVIRTYNRIAKGLHRIQTEKGLIRATAEHPFWVQGKGWVEAQYLEHQDPIATIDGDVLVYSNSYDANPAPVFNFSVSGTQTYFAGEMGAWVHNVGVPCRIRVELTLKDFPHITLRKIDMDELFPDTPGSGNYGQRLKDEYPDLKDEVARSYQAHHVIPKDIFNSPDAQWLRDAGFDGHSPHNLIPLKTCEGCIGAIHNGSHRLYSDAVRDFVKNINNTKFNGVAISDASKKEIMVRGIERAREALNNNTPPLRNTDGATKAAWDDILQKAIDDEIAILTQLADS